MNQYLESRADVSKSWQWKALEDGYLQKGIFRREQWCRWGWCITCQKWNKFCWRENLTGLLSVGLRLQLRLSTRGDRRRGSVDSGEEVSAARYVRAIVTLNSMKFPFLPPLFLCIIFSDGTHWTISSNLYGGKYVKSHSRAKHQSWEPVGGRAAVLCLPPP